MLTYQLEMFMEKQKIVILSFCFSVCRQSFPCGSIGVKIKTVFIVFDIVICESTNYMIIGLSQSITLAIKMWHIAIQSSYTFMVLRQFVYIST